MLNVLIVGASGYTGAELVNYLHRHSFAKIKKIFVSNNSLHAGKTFLDIHQPFTNIIHFKFESISNFDFINDKIDVVLLATDHHVSHDLVPYFFYLGYAVFDLSVAYRLQTSKVYENYYGFVHQYKDILKKSVYGSAEWEDGKIKTAQLVSLPGCYATCIQLALRLLVEANILCNTSVVYTYY